MPRPSASRVRPSGGGEPPRTKSDEGSARSVFVLERGERAAASGDQSELELSCKRLRQLAALISVLSAL